MVPSGVSETIRQGLGNVAFDLGQFPDDGQHLSFKACFCKRLGYIFKNMAPCAGKERQAKGLICQIRRRLDNGWGFFDKSKMNRLKR